MVRDAFLAEIRGLDSYMSEEAESGVLLIQIPHPKIPCGLSISTHDDEITIGFREWHTHGEMLGGSSPDEHVSRSVRFVKDVLTNRRQIVLSLLDDHFNDAWVTDDAESERKYMKPNETLQIGGWDELAERRRGDLEGVERRPLSAPKAEPK